MIWTRKSGGCKGRAPSGGSQARELAADFPPDPRTPTRPDYSFACRGIQAADAAPPSPGGHHGRPTHQRQGEHRNGRAPVTPEIAPKKPAYATITVKIEINKANFWQIIDFLYGYYQLDLLHQITTSGSPAKQGHGWPQRAKGRITSEAIALDGVAPRANLITAPMPVAAVAGIPGLHAVSARP